MNTPTIPCCLCRRHDVDSSGNLQLFYASGYLPQAIVLESMFSNSGIHGCPITQGHSSPPSGIVNPTHT